MTKRLFHLISDESWAAMRSANLTWNDVKKHHRQPEWCSYPDALDGYMGCWSLVGRKVTGRDFCKTCDCYSEPNLDAAAQDVAKRDDRINK